MQNLSLLSRIKMCSTKNFQSRWPIFSLSWLNWKVEMLWKPTPTATTSTYCQISLQTNDKRHFCPEVKCLRCSIEAGVWRWPNICLLLGEPDFTSRQQTTDTVVWKCEMCKLVGAGVWKWPICLLPGAGRRRPNIASDSTAIQLQTQLLSRLKSPEKKDFMILDKMKEL